MPNFDTVAAKRASFQRAGNLMPNIHAVIIPKPKALGLAPRESCRDSRYRGTGYMAEAGTIGRMTPADYGFGGPPVRHGSNQGTSRAPYGIL
jgi:hypothetical protein